MAASFVKQYQGGSSTAQTTGTAITITAPASGNALVMVVSLGSTTSTAQVSSIATTGGTWANVARSAMNATTSVRTEIWVCTGATISGTSVTPTFSATSKWAASVQEWSGLTATVDVTAVTATGAVTSGTHTTASTALSSPGGALVIGGMALATSNASTDFSAATTGSPDAATALTWKGSGATTASNVALQAVYDISSAGFTAEAFTWTTAAAWQYAWAAVTLHAKASTYSTTAPIITGTVSRAQTIVHTMASTCTATVAQAKALARAAFAVTLTGLAGANARVFVFARSSFAATCTGTNSRVRTIAKALSSTCTPTIARVQQVAHTVAATLTQTVTRVQAITHGSAAVLMPTVIIARLVVRATWSATCTASSSLGRTYLFPRTSFASTCTATVVRAQQMAKALASTITGTASSAWATTKSLSSACAATVARTQAVLHTTAAALAPTPVLAKALALAQATFTASLGGTVSLLRTTGKVLLAACATVGTRTQSTAHTLAATCQATVSRTQQLAHGVVATLTLAPTLAKVLALTRATFAASVSASVSLARATGKALVALCTGAVARTQQVTHTLVASVTGSVLLARQTAHALVAAMLTTSAALLRTAQKALAALLRADPYPLGTVDCADTFVRANQSGWGTASDGNTWSATTLTTAITGNEGTATGSASQFVTTLGSASATSDQEVLVRVKASVLPVQAGPVARMTTNTTWVAASMSTGGISIIESKPGNSFNHSVGGSVSAGTFYWMRLRVVGALAWVRTWPDGSPEPTAWTGTGPVALLYETNAGKAGLLTWLTHAGDTLSVDTFSATPVLSTPPAWQLSKVQALASTCTATVSFAKAIAGLVRTIFSANLPPAPGTLLSTPSQQDTFARADQSGTWGTATDGEVWTTPVANSTPTLAISSNEGTFLPTNTSAIFAQQLGTQTYGAAEVLARVRLSDVNMSVTLKLGAGTNFGTARLTGPGSGGATDVTLLAQSLGAGNASTNLGGSIAYTDFIWVRLRLIGGILYARAWKDGTSEPTTWPQTRTGLDMTEARAANIICGAAFSTLPTTPAQVDSFSVTELAPLSKNPAKTLAATITGALATLGRTFAFARSAFTGSLRSYVAVVHEDTFVRADQSGWGTASDGETWTNSLSSGGSPTLAISSNRGTYTGSTLQDTWVLSSPINYLDAELLLRFKLSALAGSGHEIIFHLYRDTLSNNSCALGIERDGHWYLFYNKTGGPNGNSGAGGIGAGGNVNTLSANTDYWVRLRRDTGVLYGRVWQDGTTEPTTWNSTGAAPLSNVVSGSAGLTFTLNQASDLVSLDSFSVRPYPSLAPNFTRTFDVVRSRLAATLTQTTASVRAVIKALAASTPPSALALTPAAQDTFVRPDQSGWGTASDGTPWTVFQEGGYTRAISGNTGTLTNQTNQEILTLGSAPSSPRQEALVRFKVNTFGPQTSLGLYLRYLGSASYIALNVRGSAGTWRVIGLTAGLQTSSDDAGTLSAGTFYWARVRAVEATVYGKVWADGTTEPTAWGATVTGGRVPLMAGWTALAVQLDAITDVLFVNSFSATPFQSAQLSRSPAKALAATLAGLASYGKDLAGLARTTFASSLGGASTLLRTAGKTLAASLTALTDLIAHFPQVKYFVAACMATGAYTRDFAQHQAAALGATAGLLRATTRAFAASLLSAAILARQTGHQLQAMLAPAVLLLVRDALAVLSSTIGAQGTLRRATARAAMTTSLIVHAQLGRGRALFLAATMQALSLLRRTPAKALAGTSTLTTTTRRAIVRALVVSLALTSRLHRALVRATLAVTLVPTGLLLRQARPALHSALTALASQGRAVRHVLPATLPLPGALRRATRYGLATTLVLGPFLRRSVVLLRVGPAAILGSSAGLARTAGPVLRAHLAAAGAVRHDVTAQLRVTLDAMPRLLRATVGQLAAQLPAYGTPAHFIAPIRLALRAGRQLARSLVARARAASTHRGAALEVPMRGLAAVGRRLTALRALAPGRALHSTRVTRLVATRLAPEREDAMIAQPVRADASSLYVAPHEHNVGFTIDMTAALPPSTHVASVSVFAVTSKWPGQPEDAAVPVSGFAAGPGVASDVITLVVGDGHQVEGQDYQVVLLATYTNSPATVATLYVEIPCRKGAPQP